MRIPIAVCALLMLLCACAPVALESSKSAAPPSAAEPANAPVFGPEFWKTWGDGAAELAAYDLVYPRYGEPRRGTAVVIFVTETFSESARVKADPGRHPKSDEFPAIKLLLIRDFPTGIYEYNDMLSVFVTAISANGLPAGSPVKVSFSRQEWCGHIYKHALFYPGRIRITSHSYFDGEGDQQVDIEHPALAFVDDSLLLWARGMVSPVLQPGESRQLALLEALEDSRGPSSPAMHRTGELSRPKALFRFAGVDAAVRQLAIPGGGAVKKVYVDPKPPYRILGWESDRGERAQLIRSERIKYWDFKDLKSADMLSRLGLRQRPPRTM